MTEVREIVPINIEDYAMTTEKVVRQVGLIQEVMAKVMKANEHYGVIPGTTKPSVLKPGAEKLSHTFRFATEYRINRSDLPGNHREYEIVCRLTHQPTGVFVAEGVGSCSTMETKYRYRKAEAKCPECGKEAIIKGKKEYGGGWLCYSKKGGCGAKFKDGNPAIENMDMGRIEYDNPADYYNTALKIAKKRAHVDAVLTATAASDIFTQDVEDLPPEMLNPAKPEGRASDKKPEIPPAKPIPRRNGSGPAAPSEDPGPDPGIIGPDSGLPEYPTNKPTAKQVKMIFAKGGEHGLSKEETTQLVEWFRKGDKLTKSEASSLIDRMVENWDGLVDDFLAAQAEKEANESV